MLAALGYGSGDFTAGLAARRASTLSVNPIVFAAATVTIAAIMPWTHLAAPSLAAVGWGVASGVGNGAGAVALLAGFRRAPFSLAGPLSSLVGAGLAVLAGIALGNRPTAVCWAGLLLAVPAIMAVASSTGERRQNQTMHRAERTAVYFGLAAGAGSAMSLIGLARASTAAGIWPVLAAQAAACATTVVFARAVAAAAVRTRRNVTAASGAPAQLARSSGQQMTTPLQAWPLAVTSGVLTGLAEMSFFYAAHTGMLAVSAVITSLFPAVTVGLAVLVTEERPGTIRLAGLGLTVVSVSLIAMAG